MGNVLVGPRFLRPPQLVQQVLRLVRLEGAMIPTLNHVQSGRAPLLHQDLPDHFPYPPP